VFLLGLATQGPPLPPLWSPAAGLGLCLVAWRGWRFAAPVLVAASLLLAGYAPLARPAAAAPSLIAWGALAAALDACEPALAWWLYRRGHGSRRLVDPRSATLFVFVAPGVAAFASALARAGLLHVLAPPGLPPRGFASLLALCWLDRALGVLVVAPPLLVIASPWLLRRGWIRREPDSGGMARSEGAEASVRIAADAGRPTRGDQLEIAGLALSASILCLLLSGLHGRRDLLGWQLWGVQILLIVWASVRQGLRGGTLVAAAAAAAPLLARQGWRSGGWPPPPSPEDDLFEPLVQAHLLAQCAAAVLVGAAAGWARLHEIGYRQIAGHIPVVIYSARLLPAAEGKRQKEEGKREEKPGDASSLLPFAFSLLPSLAEVTLVSAASERLLGCPPDDLLGDYRRWLALVDPEDHEVVLAAVEQLARQEQPVTCEYRLAAPAAAHNAKNGWDASSTAAEPAAGAVRWLRDTLAPQRDADGRLLGWNGVVSDITEQRALADDLRRTTSMLHCLVANLPTGVFFVQGPHGRPLLVNARARQLLGQREDSAAGLDYLSKVYRLFRPDGSPYPAEELPVYLALRRGLTTMRDDIVVHRPDGRRVPLVTWAAPVQLVGPSASIPGGPAPRQAKGLDAAVWVLEDLTALHQAEAARKDSEGRLRAVIEAMAEGLLVHDARGAIVNGNPAACSFFGVSAEQMRGRALHEVGWNFLREDGSPLPHEDFPAPVVLRTARAVRNLVLGAYPASLSPPASAPLSRPRAAPWKSSGPCPVHEQVLGLRWLLVHAVPLGSGERATQGGAPAGVVTTFSDITAYVQAREAIRASEERYRGLVESLPVMVVLSDRDMRVTYVNPATQAITGYDLAEVSDPAAWAKTVHPEDLPRVYEISRNALAGQSDRGEFRYRAKDNTEKTAWMLCEPRYQDGGVVGAITLLLDVTRERNLERELQRAQRLELVGRLSSGVAHDFNNLLGVVLNLTDLARGHLPGDHPVHADLKRIAEAGEQAAALAGQLLAFSKQKSAAPRRVEVNSVVRRTLELLQATLPAGICIRADLAAGEAPIRADETQVQQVLMNLCLNARDAMPGGGTLHVRTRVERAGEVGQGGAGPPGVLLSVEDSGNGISEELRGRIFEPFFSTREGGTGLGLAVVQQIVESYGGAIEVHSRAGQGARFDIRWPMAGA
jgi:PAS domain S-box-containing protein